MNRTKSTGQGKFHSKLSQNVTSDGTSIVKRLASRSVTGRGLQIQIHQHIGFQLNLVWHTTSNGKETSRCREILFLMYEDVTDFCETLMSRAFEGMCDGVCVHVIEWLKDKVEQCRVNIITCHKLKKSIIIP